MGGIATQSSLINRRRSLLMTEKVNNFNKVLRLYELVGHTGVYKLQMSQQKSLGVSATQHCNQSY